MMQYLVLFADLLLIGTGTTIQQLHQDVQGSMRARGIQFETMDTVSDATCMQVQPAAEIGHGLDPLQHYMRRRPCQNSGLRCLGCYGIAA